ncbi:MAG: FkbM family methyltransferase [Rhodobacteraceae bacterium]|nr:FkbM family methyltransferase [Paracoccaceae bacterium]
MTRKERRKDERRDGRERPEGGKRAGRKAPVPALAPPASAPALFHDTGLLEACRTKWQYAAWDTLAALPPEEIARDPDRAKIALLVAAALSHAGTAEEARRFALQALEWGADRRIAARVLLSAATNSLGRIAACLDEAEVAGRHFDAAIGLVEPRSDVTLLARTRRLRELARLGLLPDAARELDAELWGIAKDPADHAARVAMMRTEIDLLKEELRLSIARGQVFGDRAPAPPEGSAAAPPRNRSTSQLGQDLWVLERSGHKLGGFFVEFGATDGVLLSNSWLLETDYGWRGICVEPNPGLFAELRRNRRCQVSDACIGPESGREVEFILADAFGTIADYAGSDMHAARRAAYRSDGRVIRLKTESLHDLLTRLGAPRDIDYLSVDTEGSEYDILAGFPFERWNVRLITVEHNHGPRREDIRRLLEGRGYRRTEAQWDDWYERTP